METETIKAGEWIITEGGPIPQYFIYKLLKGNVAIFKRGKKVRDVEIKEGEKPIMIGITAVLREDRKHMASVKAVTDVEVERIYFDQVIGVLANEMPKEVKQNLSVMVKSITMGNEIICMLHEFYDIPRVTIEIPDNIDDNPTEILKEIKRLYALINEDVNKICK